jgi:hypothetical protein
MPRQDLIGFQPGRQRPITRSPKDFGALTSDESVEHGK